MSCDVCGGAMGDDVIEDTYRCKSCGFYKSTLPVLINHIERIDEASRAIALKPIRTANFSQMLDECEQLVPRNGTILDVGCAHGWFIEAAKARGYSATGIEPDNEMAKIARKSGHDVHIGYFPDDLPAEQKYSAITFNDVFEHLPDVNAMAQAIRSRLEPGGVAIINLPVSDGIIYRVARIAAKLGIKGPLERMWQKGLPSPHLSYFSRGTLPTLMERAGFTLVKDGDLESIRTDGLYERIRYDKNVSTPKAAAIYASARLLKGISSAFPSDIRYFVFKVT